MKHKSNKLPPAPQREDFLHDSLWLKAMSDWSRLALEYATQQAEKLSEKEPMNALRAQAIICYKCKYFNTCPMVVDRYSYDSDEIIFCPKVKNQIDPKNYLFVKEERVNKLSRVHVN